MKNYELSLLFILYTSVSIISSCCTGGEPSEINLAFAEVEITALDTSGFNDTTPVENAVDKEDLGFLIEFLYDYTDWKQPFSLFPTAYACDDGGSYFLVEDKVSNIELFQIVDNNSINITAHTTVVQHREDNLADYIAYENENDYRRMDVVLIDIDETSISIEESTFLVQVTLQSGIVLTHQTDEFLIE